MKNRDKYLESKRAAIAYAKAISSTIAIEIEVKQIKEAGGLKHTQPGRVISSSPLIGIPKKPMTRGQSRANMVWDNARFFYPENTK